MITEILSFRVGKKTMIFDLAYEIMLILPYI
jgi:hypothetical protein